ncbi:MAG: hypothetical protein QOI01_4161 [Mycobacterium sp.]|nr:hypothetical protein [Mycobacterium sp.]
MRAAIAAVVRAPFLVRSTRDRRESSRSIRRPIKPALVSLVNVRLTTAGLRPRSPTSPPAVSTPSSMVRSVRKSTRSSLEAWP